MFIDKTLDEYIESLGSDDHVPGGGSAAGLVASLGNALISMVYNLSLDKKSYTELDEAIKDEMQENYELVRRAIESCKLLVDEDTRSFSGVIEAYKLPKGTDEEISFRKLKVEEGYKLALKTPFELSKLVISIFENIEVFAKYGNLGAITDVGIGVLFLYSSLEASNLNMRINLNNISNEAYVMEMKEYIEKTLEYGKIRRDELMDIVYGRLK